MWLGDFGDQCGRISLEKASFVSVKTFGLFNITMDCKETSFVVLISKRFAALENVLECNRTVYTDFVHK